LEQIISNPARTYMTEKISAQILFVHDKKRKKTRTFLHHERNEEKTVVFHNMFNLVVVHDEKDLQRASEIL